MRLLSILKKNKMERVTDTHVFFWNGELSNWCPCKFDYQGMRFFNSEQAFMWEKARFFEDSEIAGQIINNGRDPRRAKELGRLVNNFNIEKWLEVGYNYMVNINLQKYESNFDLREILLNTGNKTIVEASPSDRIWGIGLHWSDDRVLDENKWQGKNLLGKALMEVREKLNQE
jgi:hypothetical protein